ncbi:LLM class flavin-dependent oxidoreductase [bacterium]|nr:LLM class flavin-dependent oxidoreductase [bacterium]
MSEKSEEIIIHSDELYKQIKNLLKKEGFNFTLLKYTINQIFGKNDGVRNLHNKFARNTIRVAELEEIAEILNYEIVLRKKS